MSAKKFKVNRSNKEEQTDLTKINPEEPTIFLNHEPIYIKKAKEKNINLQLAGHTHLGQQFPFNFLTKLAYKKYHYGLHTENSYNIYTTNGVGTWGPPMRIGNSPEMVKINFK